MENAGKYTRQFFAVTAPPRKWAQKTYVEKAPIWCSVDLRDGNQALVAPMSLEEKLIFFKELVRIGFKEIEIGFPAASDTEFAFCRALIEQNLIPDDVTIQVLTQARPHIIERTFEAIKDCRKAIVHLYNSTSRVQREQVFRMTREEIIEIAVSGAKLCADMKAQCSGDIRFEYSPESFTGTEPDFALEICNAVLDVWRPSADCPVIINLPVTVELSMPHVFADQVEYISDRLNDRENVILSLHPHNDRGCAVCDAEMGLLAGAQRVEGTLFGNGERTGNVDIVTLALNMYAQGIEPHLDFSNLPAVAELYTSVTHMPVHERQPYSGKLVFAAFSGSHQDAVAKAIHWRAESREPYWTVPYLPIDPGDIGRVYDNDTIRINSQSGKGGICYLLETRCGFSLPKKMQEAFCGVIKQISDREQRELGPDEIAEVFRNRYINRSNLLSVSEMHFMQRRGIEAAVTIEYAGSTQEQSGRGNGRLAAVCAAIMACTNLNYNIVTYTEHALESGSDSKAVSYVEILSDSGKNFWGVGIDTDIIMSSVKALVSAVNNMLAEKTEQEKS